MALHDLTPELRTRMRGVERLVGLFVSVAVLLLVCGFGYYLYHTAKRKGWFETKVTCFTYLRNATGLNVGDPVKMLGFNAGTISVIKPMKPFFYQGSELAPVYVEFLIQGDNIGYVWDESYVNISTGDFLGKRGFELIPGDVAWSKKPKELRSTNLHEVFLRDSKKVITKFWNAETTNYEAWKAKDTKVYVKAVEVPALGERIEQIANTVERDLPNILGLTNAVNEALMRISALTTNVNNVLADARPVITNATAITAMLRDPRGSLGEWLIPTNLHRQLELTLTNANTTMLSANTAVTNTDTHLAESLITLNRALDGLAGITSNLNVQVEANTNILAQVSGLVRTADSFVQGLRGHWLLRSAFKDGTNRPTMRRPDEKAGKR